MDGNCVYINYENDEIDDEILPRYNKNIYIYYLYLTPSAKSWVKLSSFPFCSYSLQHWYEYQYKQSIIQKVIDDTRETCTVSFTFYWTEYLIRNRTTPDAYATYINNIIIIYKSIFFEIGDFLLLFPSVLLKLLSSIFLLQMQLKVSYASTNTIAYFKYLLILEISVPFILLLF